MAESPFTTPKRKRSEMLDDGTLNLNTATQFTFEVNPAADDGNASPRTRVAHRFRGLALGGGSGGTGSSAELSMIDYDAEDASRKRVKLPDVEMSDAAALPAASTVVRPGFPSPPRGPGLDKIGSPSGQQISPRSVSIALDDAVVEQSETIANTHHTNDNNHSTTATTLSFSTPPTPPLVTARPPAHPRSRPPKRAGTPPFPFPTTTKPPPRNTPTPTPTTTTTPPPTITDPLRASLTWHDDEITIYDPDDSDDDGTGINGIGFKPTPAEAYARTVRRRQQLAEYRKREERDARAKRSLRRRGGGSPAPGGEVVRVGGGKKGKGERRRVRFLESRVEELIGV
ncbi:hypothetical protein F5144DRAFT_550922 [Chaetomium tenue]|uniref:Uncharacterized protein n=1 Tax=Chaetomium tenue TaxID=1854479 RepID=A0ACB7P0D1_9PEZI|nr:hypothetical protein F5144DRAFT_550922 [Chaetomium globosum]